MGYLPIVGCSVQITMAKHKVLGPEQNLEVEISSSGCSDHKRWTRVEPYISLRTSAARSE